MIGFVIGVVVGFGAGVVVMRKAIRWKLRQLGMRQDLTLGEIGDLIGRPYPAYGDEERQTRWEDEPRRPTS